MIKFIGIECKKLINSTRVVSQETLRDLEQRIRMEIYLREKKHAILLDRKEPVADDQVSHLSQVQ